MAKKRHGIGIGIVGMGFMGTTHLAAALRLRGARLAAIVTRDPRKQRGDFRHVGGNFGDGGGRVSLEGVHVHDDLDGLLADESVDLVDVCLPSYLHTKATLKALDAGKDVLVEKPLALSPADAKKMIETARRRRRVLMVGQVLKFFPEFALLDAAIRDQRWGKLLALHLRRLIARPEWDASSWFADPKKSGGMVVDLHIHDTDFINYLFGKPRQVQSSGLVRSGRVDYIRTVYEYAKSGPLLTSEGGWINAPGLPFEHGYDAFFEKGTCHFNSTRTPQPVLFGKRSSRSLKPRATDAFRDELKAAVEGVRARRAPESLSAKNAALSLQICKAEERSVRSGRKEKP